MFFALVSVNWPGRSGAFVDAAIVAVSPSLSLSFVIDRLGGPFWMISLANRLDF